MAGGNMKVIGLPELSKQLAQIKDQARDALIKQVAASGLELETEAKRNIGDVGGVDTGQARASTRYRSSDGGMGAEVYSPNPVAAAIEFGTAPAGQLKQHMPPPAALEAWVERHGMPASAAYQVARKISLVGIPARPWLSRAHDTIADKFINDLTARFNKLLGK